MFEYIQKHVGYMNGSVNQGIIKGETGAIVIDTGIDKSAARKIIRTLEEQGLTLIAIINTHSHADHIGGNRALLEHFGDQVKVYAPIFEESAIRHPIWEPIYLYGGAVPIADLQNKFLMAPSSRVDHVIEPGFLEIDGVTFEVLPLYGHAYGQIGIGVGDVFFAADGFFGREVLDKHPIPFQIDLEKTFQSFDVILNASYPIIIPGHGQAVKNGEDLLQAIQENIAAHKRVSEVIIQCLEKELTIQEITKRVCDKLGIQIKNSGSYVLYETPIRSHLTYLHNQGTIFQEVRENQWLWRKA